MKVIYLDIDGVLNSRRYDLYERTDVNAPIDESRAEMLAELARRTGAAVVLSTSWRDHWERDVGAIDETGRKVFSVLERLGVRILDKTPRISGALRSQEIRAHLREHPEIDRFVILDDDPYDWGELSDCLVQTSYTRGRGFEAHHLQRALDILGEETEGNA